MDEHARSNGKRKSPATVVNGTRVTVAFPFGKIVVQQPSDELRDLAVLVADLAEAVANESRTDVTESLRTRAEELRDSLTALSGA